ncbi:hypothetical protein N9865_02615, partial [Paraglaciecola sp.]|nr:hypothetical protein [Paraglaciecola sp.]
AKEELATLVTALQTKQNELVDGQKNKDTQITELVAQLDEKTQGNQKNKQWAEALKAENENFRVNNTAQKQKLDEQLSQIQKKVSNLETENAALRANLNENENRTTELKALLENQLNDKDKKLAEQQENESAIKQELATVNKSLLETQEQFEVLHEQLGEITTQKTELQQQAKGHQETRQQAESLKALNEKLTADSAQNQNTNIQLATQITALQEKQNELVEGHKNKDTQIAAMTEQRDKEAHSHQQNKSWAASLNKQCEELKVYGAERQKSADLALKIQTKAQVDLENLREKYQHKHINEQKLVALISELRAKLQQAAEYYYELQQMHPELNKVTQTQVEPSHIEEHQTANVAELVKKTRPAKKKKRSKQAKSVNRGKS